MIKKTQVMRGVILLAVLSCFAAVLNAESEPYLGSASGDGVVLISPTNKTKTTTDLTNDDGSGEDDEDGEVYASGSAMSSSTAETPTTELETTTEQQTTTEQHTTTDQQTTTQRETTTEVTEAATTYTSTQGDDEDDYSGSGSGSASSKPQYESTSTSNDIYITSTTEQTVIIPGRSSTTESTSESSTPQPNIHFKTTSSSTEKFLPTTQSTTTTESVETTTAASNTQAIVKSTMAESETTTKMDVKTPKVYPTKQPTEQSEEEFTTERADTESTTAEDPGVMAHKKKQEEGFTLTTEVIAGVVGCALLALLLIAFLMYRLKKRDEGSYLLDESNAYPPDYKKINISDKEAFI